MGQSRKDLHDNPFYRVHGHFGFTEVCPYCLADIYLFRSDDKYYETARIDHFVKACPVCNWWRHMMRDLEYVDEFEKIAIMSKKSYSADDVPVEEVRKFLIRNWGGRREISPHKCEELVASVFKDFLDCKVKYLTNSVFAKDRGIDFVLVNDDRGVAYAFQVKRRQTEKRECVKCVREFIGCLAESPYSKGYYVTTADSFTKDVWIEHDDSLDALRERGLEISLVDGASLLNMLKSAKMETLGDKGLRQLINEECSHISTWHWIIDVPHRETKDLSSDGVLTTLGIQHGA